MESLTPYEEMAIAIQAEFEEQLDETETDQALISIAEEITREIMPEAADSVITTISKAVLKLYQPVD